MRRIFITKNIKDISKDYSKSLFKGRRANFVYPIQSLKDLEIFLRNRGSNNHADYVKQIVRKYNVLNCLAPWSFKIVKTKYFNNLTENDLNTKFKYKDEELEFYKHIVKAMRYDEVRDKEFLSYVRMLGLKTCVYCNAQFAMTIEDSKGNLSGKYELDHFLPKSKYPFLCTSFFNLQPCCSNCNKSKGNREALFGLYTQDYKELSPFDFKIKPESIIRYMLSQNCADLEIIFNSNDLLLLKDHEEKFHITELYEMQKDVAEEIIWKAKIYNDSYKKNISAAFSKLFPNNTDFNRLILGNYDLPSHCHKRPLSKLIQDIAQQLKLI